MANEFPPKLRDWNEGTPQVGVFIRTRKGFTLQLANDAGTEEQETLAFAIIVGKSKIPAEIMGPLKAWVDAEIKPGAPAPPRGSAMPLCTGRLVHDEFIHCPVHD